MQIIDKKTIAQLLSKYISYFNLEEIENIIEIPPIEINFSYAFPVFRLAKFEKKSPNDIAKELEEKITKPDFLAKIEADGPYINLRVNPKVVLGNIFELQKDYGKINYMSKKEMFKPQRIVIEYPAPNTNKPLHFGHIRNMLIGSTTSKLFLYIGHRVFQVNMYNDRGIHISKSMVAYMKWGNNQEPNIKPDHFVGQSYVRFSREVEKDPQLIEEASSVLKIWEENDPEVRELWNKMRNWTLKGFKLTYDKLGISFDKVYFESDYYIKGKEKILKGLENGIFEKSDDGAIVARLKENYNLPDKVLLRSDGTSIYITQDMYLAHLKKKDFDYDRSIYVVGNPQNLYFKQLFTILDMIGFKEDKYHFSYGMIYLPEGKMKSREGIVVDADDIIEEMETLAYKEVEKRYPELSEQEKTYRARIIGMAALKFFILKINPKSDFVFNPKESISFEGETGPYVQYCYARIESIISKSMEEIDLNINWMLLTHEKELSLINQLIYFPEIVETAAETYNIHLIPQYLLSLCQAFNSFYTSCQVISDKKNLEKARLLLIKCVQIVIEIGCDILGIEILDKM
jgi:arginyl-tRNA synthetase